MTTKTGDMKFGAQLSEGKTKRILECAVDAECVYLQSKDAITAHNAVRKGEMSGKGVIATATCVSVFSILQRAGIDTAMLDRSADDTMLCHRCDMIPIEWVTRRVATGSFLKRNPGVQEGYRFTPPKQEIFFKDDAAGDPQWSEEQLTAAGLKFGRVSIDNEQLQLMTATSLAVFEVLEKVWNALGVTLVDMKVEFGVSRKTGDVVLADVIDNDSWRLWPNGDKRLMKDKQVFRDAVEVTDEVMKDLKTNYQWVSEQLVLYSARKWPHKVVVLMGSPSDKTHCDDIRRHLESLDICCDVRVTSAHKGTDRTLKMLAEYEGLNMSVVLIAVAGRSNGLGPVLSGNTAFPVINCPPSGAPETDVWSSLRTPSGLGCSTVLYPEAAAMSAAAILAAHNPAIWSRMRAKRLNNWTKLLQADVTLQQKNQT